MLKLGLVATVALVSSLASAQDMSKYPDWSGQWKRPPGAGIQWDQTRRPGLDQNPPLTPEYKAIFEASLADQAKGGQGENLRVTCTTNGMPRVMTVIRPIEFVIQRQCADTARMDEIERAGLVSHGERVDVLSNVLAVIVPKGSRASVAGPADLAGLGHVAVADPEAVPAGIYARTYLQSVGVWEKLRDKIVPTVDVRAALAAVEGEHADAGIVYRTDAVTSSRVRVAFEVPRERGPPIVYPLAPIAASKKKDTRALVRYLTGPEAVKIYERYGFLVVVGK